MRTLTRLQARQFLLRKHGLLGPCRFVGPEGILDYIRQCGCIQFDPVDVCGKNAELLLHARVKGFTKQQLHDLLYRTRQLFDYPDKNQAILPVEDWPGFTRYRQRALQAAENFDGLISLTEQALSYLSEHGPASSSELPIQGEIFWHSVIHWSGNWHKPSNAARSVLEQLYCEGQLVIHHKEGSRKYYDLAERHLPAELLSAPDPLSDDFDHLKWRILRRIGAVGLLWNRTSDAWLNIEVQQSNQLDAVRRTNAFAALTAEGILTPVQVEGLRDLLYCRTDDLPLLEEVLAHPDWKPRCALIPPLDCLLWDKKLLKAIFDYEYTWEIYTPEAKRKYGYYVLPIVYGSRFAGRADLSADRKTGTLHVRGIWYETGIRVTQTLQQALLKQLQSLARLNGCTDVVFDT